MDRLQQILAIDGMTESNARALLEMGLDTYWEIHRLRVDTLVARVQDAVDAGQLSQGIDVNLAARWQKSAIRLGLTRHVEVVVQASRTRQPLAEATVTAGDKSGITDSQGRVRVSGVRTDCTSIQVSRDGYLDMSVDVDLRPEQVHSFRFRLAPSPTRSRAPVSLSEADGYLLEIHSGDRVRTRNRTLDALPDGVTLHYLARDDNAGQVQLLSTFRERDGNSVWADRVTVATSALPIGAQPGELLEWNQGALRPSSETRETLARKNFQKKFGISPDTPFPKVVLDGVDPREVREVPDLPRIEWEDLSTQQKQSFLDATKDHPDGIPLSLLRSILTH